MKIFKIIYNSFIIGLLISILAFQNEWLEMRVNVGLVIPVTMLMSIVVYALMKKKSQKLFKKINTKFTFINLSILIIISTITLGFRPSIMLIPAILRETTGYMKMPLVTINIILTTLLFVGFSIIFRYEERKKLAKEKGESRVEKYKKINNS